MRRISLMLLAIFLALPIVPFSALAGPPFRTDDPEPVEYQHWEIYMASQYQNDRNGVSATAPHLEINYGVYPNFQLHFIFPLEYVKPSGMPSHYGYGDTEMGVKWRFYENEETKFMIGTFPFLEIPTGDERKGLGNGDPHFGFNGGAIINITDNHHILMSMGTDIDGPSNFFSYIAYQLTFGPENPKEKGPPEAHSVGRMLNSIR